MIPTKPPPTFKDADRWSKEFLDFVSKCLVKNPEDRATATQLLQVSLLRKQPAVSSQLNKVKQSSLLPLCQNKSLCGTIVMKMCFA